MNRSRIVPRMMFGHVPPTAKHRLVSVIVPMLFSSLAACDGGVTTVDAGVAVTADATPWRDGSDGSIDGTANDGSTAVSPDGDTDGEPTCESAGGQCISENVFPTDCAPGGASFWCPTDPAGVGSRGCCLPYADAGATDCALEGGTCTATCPSSVGAAVGFSCGPGGGHESCCLPLPDAGAFECEVAGGWCADTGGCLDGGAASSISCGTGTMAQCCIRGPQ